MVQRISTLKEVIEIENLRRAWRWIKSNPDKQYKRYFREMYGDYSLIEEDVIRDLIRQLEEKTYVPSHGCKIFIPKASGILRPYTLLAIEDQIVYQAMVNIIAEHLLPRVRLGYYTSTYGNLYAGKKSAWFYRKWSTGYKFFNDAAKDAFNAGLKYSASFDLTACYDSIDHNVLRHFLQEIKCDNEFIDLLITCLSKWTGTEKSKIYHNHGIPQGPLASGLLSEVVLKHFDFKYGNQPHMKYMRYVDDIRLFAKSEKELRQMLIRFDRLSKDIGLFPQSSKIEIHEVKNIDDELKSISNPVETSVQRTLVDQDRLQKRLIKLTERFKIKNPTRFKFLLAHAIPSSKINDRVWRIYKNYISHFDSILRYFQRYNLLPKKISTCIINEINSVPVYSAVTSELIFTLDERLKGSEDKKYKRLLRSLWKPRTLAQEIILYAMLVRILIKNNLLLTIAQLRFALNTQEWYARVQAVKGLDNDLIDINLLVKLVNEKIQDESNDVACIAALIIVKRNLPLTKPLPIINSRAAMVLKETGLIAIMPSSSNWCSIDTYFNYWLNNSVLGIDWKTIFGTRYDDAKSFALICRLKAGTDTSAWVNAMDVFNDLLLDVLHKHDNTLGTYIVGNMGGTIYGGARLKAKYPKIFTMTESIHKKRSESPLSHTYSKTTGKVTKPIQHRYYTHEGKRLVKEAFKELASKW